MGPRPDTRRLSVPLGVVGVFGASNFPFAFSVMGGDSASALAAGCAVVHKIHGGHLHLAVRTGVVVVIAYRPGTDLAALARLLEGQLTATVHADPDEDVTELVTELRERAGRLVWNAWPTGVTVTYAQHHGGPYPATTAAPTPPPQRPPHSSEPQRSAALCVRLHTTPSRPRYCPSRCGTTTPGASGGGSTASTKQPQQEGTLNDQHDPTRNPSD
ncbi:MAG TPA: hypothetical protein VJ617_10320 [Arthrobacter sp.]|nr:hypothetical protein [Arthrobacter sp.]